jgi:hypothetical protein
VSCRPVVTILTPNLASGGFDLRLRDSKNQNSNSNVDPFNNADSILNPVVNLRLRVADCAGVAIADATVVVQSDHQRDQEIPSAGGELLGFTPGSLQSEFGEQPTDRVATVTTDADGEARVKVCTRDVFRRRPRQPRPQRHLDDRRHGRRRHHDDHLHLSGGRPAPLAGGTA